MDDDPARMLPEEELSLASESRDIITCSESPADRKRIVRVACNACRRRKQRCDGARPRCEACVKRNCGCVYDTVDGTETRTMALQRMNRSLSENVSQLQGVIYRRDVEEGLTERPTGHSHQSPSTVNNESPMQDSKSADSAQAERIDDIAMGSKAAALLEVLTSWPDEESTMVLARLRLGHSWEQVVLDLGIEPMSLERSNVRRQQHHRGQGSSERQVPLDTQHTFDSPSSEGSDGRIPSSIWIPRLFDHQGWMQESSGPLKRRRLNREYSTQERVRIELHSSISDLACSRQGPLDNISVPVWAMRTVNNPDDHSDPFEAAMFTLNDDFDRDTDHERFIGPHPFLGSLHDENVFKRAPHLSRFVASLVKSIKPYGTPDITQYTIFWAYWTLCRWLLLPSPETYDAMPLMMRPTPWQLFAKHTRAIDFIFSPTLREALCQLPDPEPRWMTEACETIRFKWPKTLLEALCKNDQTGELDLNSTFKEHAQDQRNWSVGPSIRPYLRNADQYWDIR